MKTLKNLTLLLFMSLAIMSCSKDDDTNDDDDQGNGGSELFTAKVDGSNWSSDSDIANLIGGSLVTANGLTTLVGQGSTNEGSFITLTIIGYNGTGTYAIADGDLDNRSGALYGVSPSSDDIYQANSIIALGGDIGPGEIVVTSQNDSGAEGTFKFEASNGDNTVNVTDGKFKIVFDN